MAVKLKNMESIIEILLLIVFKIPGAIVRWLLSGCKRPLKNYIDNGDAYLDGSIGLVTIVLIVILLTKLLT